MDKRENRLYKIMCQISPILVIGILVLAFEIAIDVFEIPNWILAKPSAAAKIFIKNLSMIWPYALTTIREILVGYAIGVSFGITLALIFTSNKWLDKAVSPYVVFLIVTPQIILVPLLMLWLGFGIEVKILAVALSTFPINMMSTMTGVRNVSHERYELMKSLKASKLQTFFKVLIPSALPNVFTGMRLATIFASTAAIGAELISGNIGLGPQISYYTEFMQIDHAFAFVFAMLLISVGFYTLVGFVENKLLARR